MAAPSLMRKLKETRGDFTINGVFILLLVFLLLALAISVFGVINRSMKLHSMAAELVRYAKVRGLLHLCRRPGGGRGSPPLPPPRPAGPS